MQTFQLKATSRTTRLGFARFIPLFINAPVGASLPPPTFLFRVYFSRVYIYIRYTSRRLNEPNPLAGRPRVFTRHRLSIFTLGSTSPCARARALEKGRPQRWCCCCWLIYMYFLSLNSREGTGAFFRWRPNARIRPRARRRLSCDDLRVRAVLSVSSCF